MLKKVLCCVLSAVVFVCTSIAAECISYDDISAKSAVIYCAETGEVLFEKNSAEQRSMASTTKIMTALLALEENTPDRIVTVTEEMVRVEGTSSGLKAGDMLTLRDIVYCMLLESGNEAANAAAIAIGGSFESFADMMNEKAKEIGMNDTSFVTPSGLDDENHYTTAYDMAVLTAHALENPEFVEICSSKKHKITFENSEKAITLYNHNRLLSEYDDCIGVKTGFTKKSGRCLVSAAKREGITIIAVTLFAPNDWQDHKKMLDFGFEMTETTASDNDFSSISITVTNSDKASVGVIGQSCLLPCVTGSDMQYEKKVYLQKFLYAPVKKGDVVGFAEYSLGGRAIKKIPLTAAEDAPIKAAQKKNNNIFDRLFGLFDSWWKHDRQ